MAAAAAHNDAMSTSARPEVWLRGPVPGVAPLLQPVAHGLLQCAEEVGALLAQVPAGQIWERPGGAASIGFHIRHAAGSLDRLLTYARGEPLSAAQLALLLTEGDADSDPDAAATLQAVFADAVARALEQVSGTPEATLLEARAVGRGRLPSTVIGLLVHAAEHTGRHVGQAVTTARVVAGRGVRPAT